jgi:uncharacterized membrane protein
MCPSNISSRSLRFLLIFFLVIGIFLRFTSLDNKIYWLDEVATSFRIAGYTIPEVTQQIYNGKILGINDLMKYQRPYPEKSLIDTINALVIDDSQHTPLYYIIVRLWSELAGNSPAIIRSLSVVISLLIFPCFYWLCIELFNSALVGWIILASTSVSLLHIIYAQEAREYSLWIVTILFSSIAFLRAIRLKTKLSFWIYTTSLILGLYTFPLTGIVLLGQGIYIAIIERFRLTKTLGYFLISSTIATLSFLPWIWIILSNASRVKGTMSWMFSEHSFQDLIYIWSINLTNVFVHYSRFRIFFLILFLFLLYFLYSKVSRPVWLFVFTLTIPTLIVFAYFDLVFNSSLSYTPRYLWPFFLGTQIAFAFIVDYMLTSNSKKNWLKKTGIITLVLTLIVGYIGSVTAVTESYKSSPIYLAANVINRSSSPLIINFINTKKDVANSEIAAIGDIFSLSYLLQSNSKFLLFKQPNIPKIPSGFSDIFVFSIYKPKAIEDEPDMLGIIEKVYHLQPIALNEGEKTILWKVSSNS